MHIIPKGSITIDGVSLTVNEAHEDGFSIMIVPHTLKNTLMQTYQVGSTLNIETDMFARYIDYVLARKSEKKPMSWGEIDTMQMAY